MNKTVDSEDYKAYAKICMQQRYWPYYVASILVTLFGGLLVILFIHGCVALTAFISRKRKVDNVVLRNSFYNNNEVVISGSECFSPMSSHFGGSVYSGLHVRRMATTNCGQHCVNGLTSCISCIRRYAIRLVSYQSISGRIFIAVSMLLSLASFGIYVSEATMWPSEIEKCGHKGRRHRRLDFIFNMYFLFHFVARLAASEDKLRFWLDWFSILDYVTVPPTLLAFLVNRSWSGLRFVRIFRLVNLAEVLHNLNIIKSASSLRFCQLCSFFLSVWLAGAGMVYLLENTGDPFGAIPYNNSVVISYTQCLYFTIVTMSTVGYGDITPRTVLGQTFCCFFILLALAAFASCIPEIFEMFCVVSKYSGKYVKQSNRRHVVVCGDVTTESVKHFLDDFLHPDRRKTDVEVVFINRSTPDLQLQSIIRRNFTRVRYFQGTVMNCADLERVAMTEADACLVLANSCAVDPNEEDAANIMRVIAVKNYASKVRCIVQILQQVNKSYLLNIPTWNWHAGDEVVCFSELKLGFLAQSCLAPGFSTLLTNLFSMQSLHGPEAVVNAVVAMESVSTPDSCLTRSEQLLNESRAGNLGMPTIALKLGHGVRELYNSSLRRKGKNKHGSDRMKKDQLPVPDVSMNLYPGNRFTADPDSWLGDYLRGVSNELYSAQFSSAFDGMDFAEAGCLCMTRLELMLIAVVANLDPSATSEGSAFTYLAINPPASSGVIISEGTVGFFICDSQKIATRATNYCAKCHSKTKRLSQIRECECNRRQHGRVLQTIQKLRDRITSSDAVGENSLKMEHSGATSGASYVEKELKADMKCTDEVEKGNNAKPKLDVTGVYHWSPKRSLESAILRNNHNVQSNIKDSTLSRVLCNHVLVCILAGKKAPLLGLRSFVLPLRASNIPRNDLRPIVFLGNLDYLCDEWCDIDNFPDVYIIPGSPLNRKDLWTARIQMCSVSVVIGVSDSIRVDDPYLLDKEAILCSLNIRALKIPMAIRESVCSDIAARCTGVEIPVLTALTMDSNIHFLDPEDFETGNSDIDVYLTVPFARGLAFTGSVLDALVSTAYFDRNAMTLIRHLVTGGTTPVLEQWAAHGGDFYDNLQTTTIVDDPQMTELLGTLNQSSCKRPQLNQLSFNDQRLGNIMRKSRQELSFGNLFCAALRQHTILCLGIFRLNPTAQLSAINSLNNSFNLQQGRNLTRRPSACASEEAVKMRSLFERNLLSETRENSPALSPIVDRMNLPLGPHSANNRYVITNPPFSFHITATDLIFCLTPS